VRQRIVDLAVSHHPPIGQDSALARRRTAVS
jgi:hypothetical protein